jgi:hypothetical protein
MGEEEDEFAEAEALLQRLQLEEQQREVQAQQEVEVVELNDTNTMEVVSGPGIIEQAVEAQSVAKEPVKPKKLPNKDIIASLDKRVAEMAQLLNSIYPDNWHIYRNQDYIKENPLLNKIISSEDHYTNHTIIAIRFPEITITNTKGHSNVIKDLFVFMYMSVYDNTETDDMATIMFASKMWGTRATLREEEFNSNYIHSHLPRRSTYSSVEKPYTCNVSINNFCLGGGTETSSALADLNYNFDILNFELFLYQLSTYVEHESLGGGPYMRMDTIRIGGGRSYSAESISDCTHILSRYIASHNNREIPIKSAVKDGEIAIVYDSTNEEHLNLLGELTSYPYEKTETGELIPIGENLNLKTKEELKKLEGLMFDFRGNPVSLTVIPHPATGVKDPVKYPSTKLLNYVTTCINLNIKTFNSLLYAE